MLGTREVGFYATGEPLINSDLERYIAKAKKIGYTYIYITTNGALLTKDRMKSIITAGVDSIKFSINAGTEKRYEAIHGSKDFNKVLKNLRHLYDYRVQIGGAFKIYVSTILTRYTIEDGKILHELIKNIVDDHLIMHCINQAGSMHEINTLLAMEEDTSPYASKGGCPLPFNKLHISYEGYLDMCCADFQNYLAVADLNNCSLKEAWECALFQDMRRKHRQGALEGTLCYNCLHNKREKICPINERLASEICMDQFDKSKEILERIKMLAITD